MRIGLVADPCDPKKPGGLGRFVYELTRAICTADTEHALVLFVKEPVTGLRVEQRALGPNVWLTGAGFLDPSLDLYVFFTPVIPLFFRPKRSIVIAQDFAYLELPRTTLREKTLALVSYLMHRRSLRLANRVVTISEATRQSVLRHFALAPEKCIAIPLAAMPAAAPAEYKGLPEHFFLFAGVLKERKNVANLIRAFAIFAASDTAQYQFLLAGKTGGPYYDSLVALAHEFGVSDRVRFLGYISDGELAYIYTKATALVFASLVEGFGMPVLEAFRAGLPVITSNEGALAEIAGDAALLVDPLSPVAIAQSMTRLADDAGLRTTLSSRGREREKTFSWERAARELYAVIDTL